VLEDVAARSLLCRWRRLQWRRRPWTTWSPFDQLCTLRRGLCLSRYHGSLIISIIFDSASMQCQFICNKPLIMLKKVKALHTRSWSRCTGGQPAGVSKLSPGFRLPLLSTRSAVTFPAAEHHCPLAGTKLYCLVIEAHRCEQLADSCYAAFALSRIWTHDLLLTSPTLYPAV